MPAETPDRNGQKVFYGQDLRALFPLGFYSEGIGGKSADGQTESPEKKLRDTYKEWLQENHFGKQICFLDITFGPETGEFRNSSLRTIVLAPSERTMTAYRTKVLDEFFLSGLTLAAHPVFRAGLPFFGPSRSARSAERRSFAEQLENAQPHIPQDNKELQACYSPESFDLLDDGFLFDEFPVENSAASPGEESGPPSFKTQIFRTFTDSELDAGGAGRDDRLATVWEAFTSLLRTNVEELRSWRGKTLKRVFALPLGLRDPSNPRHFSWIADIYVGFDSATTEEESRHFIRQLLLHLLRANSVQKTRNETMEYLLNSFGHEVKQVTRLISPAWVVPAANLLDVRTCKPSDDFSVSRGKIGELTLCEEFSSLVNENFLIVPFGRLLRAAQQTIDLWSWQNSSYNVPQTADRSDKSITTPAWLPKTWEELITHAWKLARDQKIMNDMSGGDALTDSNLLKLRARLDTDLRLYDAQAPHLAAGSALPEAMKGEIFRWRRSVFPSGHPRDRDTQREWENQRIKASFAMLRVFVAWFSNCVKHGDRKVPIAVKLDVKGSDQLGRVRYEMTVENSLGPGGDNPQAAGKSSSTLQSVRLALEDIDGAIKKHAESPNNKYTLVCIFYWPGVEADLPAVPGGKRL